MRHLGHILAQDHFDLGYCFLPWVALSCGMVFLFVVNQFVGFIQGAPRELKANEWQPATTAYAMQEG